VHELSIAQAIAQKAQDRAGSRPVSTVAIRLGHFRQVVPDALELCWTMITEASSLRGCRLEIEQVPATVYCQDCDTTTTLDYPILLCGTCDQANVTLMTGQEFMVVSLELPEV
jgi:hydrogenase nickel incorporation protein HypA/HybF